MKIIKATIIQSNSTDAIILHTDLKESCWPYTGQLTLDFRAVQGSGIDYMTANFPGVPYEIVKRG